MGVNPGLYIPQVCRNITSGSKIQIIRHWSDPSKGGSYPLCRRSTSWRWHARGSWRRGGGWSGWGRWCCCWRGRRCLLPCRGLWRDRPLDSERTAPDDLQTWTRKRTDGKWEHGPQGKKKKKVEVLSERVVRLPLEMDTLLGLAMKQVRQTWIEQRKPRFTGAVGA